MEVNKLSLFKIGTRLEFVEIHEYIILALSFEISVFFEDHGFETDEYGEEQGKCVY